MAKNGKSVVGKFSYGGGIDMEFNGFLFCGVLIMLGLNMFNRV